MAGNKVKCYLDVVEELIKKWVKEREDFINE